MYLRGKGEDENLEVKKDWLKAEVKLKLITQRQFWNTRRFQCNPQWKIATHGSYITTIMNSLNFMVVIRNNHNKILWIHSQAPITMWIVRNMNICGSLRPTAVKWVTQSACFIVVHVKGNGEKTSKEKVMENILRSFYKLQEWTLKLDHLHMHKCQLLGF